MILTGIGGALGLGVSRVAKAMAADLARQLGRPARVLALGDPLGRALEDEGLPVIVVSAAPRRRKQSPPRVVAAPTHLPFLDRSFDALCAAGLPTDSVAALRELARVVRDGGIVSVATATSALVRKVAPPEMVAATLLHAPLVDLEQRLIGSTLLSSGRVRALPAP